MKRALIIVAIAAGLLALDQGLQRWVASREQARDPREGGLACTSTPIGAEVSVDGVPTGRRTPISSQDPIPLRVGRHTVEFRVDGASGTQDLEITANQVTVVKARLEGRRETFSRFFH